MPQFYLYKETVNILIIVSVSIMITLFIVIYLNMQSFDFETKNKKAEIIKINLSNKCLAEEMIISKLLPKSTATPIENDLNCEMNSYIKNKSERSTVILIAKTKEVTDQLVKNYYKYYEKIETENPYLKEQPYISFIEIIIAERANALFKSYYNKKNCQEYRRFKIAIGIALDEEKIYIIPNTNGLYNAHYKSIIKKVKKSFAGSKKEI